MLSMHKMEIQNFTVIAAITTEVVDEFVIERAVRLSVHLHRHRPYKFMAKEPISKLLDIRNVQRVRCLLFAVDFLAPFDPFRFNPFRIAVLTTLMMEEPV